MRDFDDIDWSSLSHAYGDASDVPHRLRALVGDNWEERDDAYFRLISSIWHQGDIYEATPQIVPFLLDLMADQRGPARYYAAAVLTLVAQSALWPTFRDDISDNPARRDTRRRLVEHAEELAELRESGDAVIASAAGCVLDHLGEDAEGADDRFDETYETCESAAVDLNARDEKPMTAREFDAWLGPDLDRRGQVVAIGWARTHATAHPELAGRALEHIRADHLQHERRLAEVLVDLGRGHTDRARRGALDLAAEWLGPAEAGGFNQEISRRSVLELLAKFGGAEVRQMRRKVRAADEPEFVIPDW